VGGVTGENMLARAYRAAEFSGANMFANAHSLARMYAAMVSDGIDGLRRCNAQATPRLAPHPQWTPSSVPTRPDRSK
jgi:hypothetical protein